jgi:hypothetical protein
LPNDFGALMWRCLVATVFVIAVPHGGALAQTKSKEEIVALIIRTSGYHCPAVKSARYMGETHRGPQLRAWCGGADKDGNPLYFRILMIEPLPIAEPWRE